jgi:hypothetical protein
MMTACNAMCIAYMHCQVKVQRPRRSKATVVLSQLTEPLSCVSTTVALGRLGRCTMTRAHMTATNSTCMRRLHAAAQADYQSGCSRILRYAFMTAGLILHSGAAYILLLSCSYTTNDSQPAAPGGVHS